MSIQTFAYLSLADKLAFVHENGSFIMRRQTDVYQVSLFDCENFFAEVWFHSGCKEIDYIRAFRSHEILEPYLSAISIESLLPVLLGKEQ